MASATTADSVRLLRESLAGRVLAPGDAGYDEARRLHNGLIDKRPAMIARCLQTADVVAAIDLAEGEGSRSPFAAAGTTSRARQSSRAA
jgi:hypothetical protein